MRHGSAGRERGEKLLTLCEETEVPDLQTYSLFRNEVLRLYEASGYQSNSLRTFIDTSDGIATGHNSHKFQGVKK